MRQRVNLDAGVGYPTVPRLSLPPRHVPAEVTPRGAVGAPRDNLL
jgi:hypothetical protein